MSLHVTNRRFGRFRDGGDFGEDKKRTIRCMTHHLETAPYCRREYGENGTGMFLVVF